MLIIVLLCSFKESCSSESLYIDPVDSSPPLELQPNEIWAELRKSFSCRPSEFDRSHIRQVLSGVSDSYSSRFPLPSHMSVAEAVSRRLLPERMSLENNYTESDRIFLELATRLNWTQGQSREVLHMIRDPHFRREHLSAGVLRQVSF